MRIFFVFSFLFLLSVKNMYVLSAILFIMLLYSRFKFFKKVFKSIFLFNSAVSLGYILMGFFVKTDVIGYVLYINLKVFTVTYFVFLFFSKVNIVKFFSFSRDLSYLLTITLSQIYSYQKTFEEFKMAFKARVVSIRDKEKDFIANTFKFFFKKAIKDSEERTLAMRARGFFEN